MTEVKLPFFSRGEVSPRLYGRVDTAAYQSGLRTGLNAIVDVAGGVMNRPGTIFIAPTKYYDEEKYTRLIPFAFNTTDTHMLEFGDFYMRVIREDFPQLELNPVAITGITTGNPTTIHVTSHHFSNGDEVILDDIVGTTDLNEGFYTIADQTGTSFTLKSKISDTYVDSSTYSPWVSGGTVDRIFEIVTPYAAADLPKVKYAQSADVMYLTHTSYPPQELKRFGLNLWTITPSVFNSVEPFPSDVSATPNDTPGTTECLYQVTATTDGTNVESLPGLPTDGFTIVDATQANPIVITTDSNVDFEDFDEVYIEKINGMDELNNRRFVINNVSGNTFELKDEDGSNYDPFLPSPDALVRTTFFRLSTSSDSIDNTVSWTVVPGATIYDVYKAKDGIFGFIGETNKTSFEDDNIDPDTSQQPPHEENPFRLPNDYPGAVGFYQQRKVMGGSNNQPDTWRASQPGDFNNYTTSTPTEDDDSITSTLTSGQVNQIKHFITFDSLGVFTSGQEWTINTGGDPAFTPFTAHQIAGTNWGISEHRPYMVGATTVFIQEDNRTVRSYQYDNVYQTFKSSNLSRISDHIFFDYQVKDWALARTPYSATVFTRTDGLAAMMVYDEENSVIGWTRWDTQGQFETVGVVRVCLELETPEPDDGIYFTVRRKLPTGKWVRYIERLHKRRFNDVRDAFFVDCGRSYDMPKKITDITTPSGVVTIECPAHGYVTNNVVLFRDILWQGDQDINGNFTQPVQLNDQQYLVVSTTIDTFTIKPLGVDTDLVTVDSFAAAYHAYISGGAVRLLIDEVTGLDHLEGMFVSVLADGYPLRGLQVVNGKVGLPGLAGSVHVGLSYRTDIETLNLEPQMGSNSIQGRMKRINKIWARFDKSRELLVGVDENNLNPLKRVPFQTPFPGLSPQIYTGDREITVPPKWDGEARCYFRMLDPLPFTLLGVYPEFITS